MQYQNNENTIMRKKNAFPWSVLFTSDMHGNVLAPIFCLRSRVSFLDLWKAQDLIKSALCKEEECNRLD